MITSVTKGIDEEIGSFQKPHEHIPNGFDGEIFDPNKYSKKDSVFRIVYHGRFSRLHDIESLREISLRVKELNPNIEFLIIGPIPEHVKNQTGEVFLLLVKKLALRFLLYCQLDRLA